MKKICKNCVNTTNNKDCICDECKETMKVNNYIEAFDFSNDSIFYKDFENFIKSRKNKSVLYAYSGGQDSTAVLYLLKRICEKYNVKLKLFTIENGFKGEKTWKNIIDVISYLNLQENFTIYDIRKNIVTDKELVSIFGENNTVEEIYAMCFLKNILPCGKICNKMMDMQYKEILNKENEELLITGGDTLKVNNNELSIYWQKKNGLKIVRGGAGFRISKNEGKEIIKENNIPWHNPEYGGYDTDCLLPGSIFASKNKGIRETSPEDIATNYGVVLEYLKERSRMKIIDRETAINNLHELDLNSYSGYIEAKNTASKILAKRIDKRNV